MTRIAKITLALLLVVVLGASLATGCRKQMVTVSSGEIVLCEEGHVISDSTAEIEVPADEVAEHAVTTSVVLCELHEKLAALYARAQQALADGDLEAAEKSLAEIEALEPSYRNAAAQLADVRQGRAPSGTGTGSGSGGATPGGGGSGGTTPGGGSGGTTPGTTPPGPEDGLPEGPVAVLLPFMPDTLPGYVGQGIIADPFVLTRDYLPAQSSDVLKLVVVAEQFADSASAGRAQTALNSRYAASSSTVSVGSKQGYFGVRDRYAAVTVVDGAVLVAFEIFVNQGDPAAQRSALTAVAAAVVK